MIVNMRAMLVMMHIAWAWTQQKGYRNFTNHSDQDIEANLQFSGCFINIVFPIGEVVIGMKQVQVTFPADGDA